MAIEERMNVSTVPRQRGLPIPRQICVEAHNNGVIGIGSLISNWGDVGETLHDCVMFFDMRIVHISDFHLFSSKPETAQVTTEVNSLARKIVSDIANLQPPIDLVVFTGDLVDGGSRQDYELFKSILKPIEAPILPVIGNHDHRNEMKNAFANELPFQKGDALNFEMCLGPHRIIGLDTVIDGESYGGLTSETLDWLKKSLSNSNFEFTYILMHHPPFSSGSKFFDSISLRSGRNEFASLIKSYNGSIVILAGHLHCAFQTIWNGAFGFVSGSPAFQLELDPLSESSKPTPTKIPYSYFVHHVHRDRLNVFSRHVCP